MVAAVRDANAFIVGKREADLARDRQLTLALLKCVEIIGEAAAHVGVETRAKHPRVPWGHIVGMRNRLIHNYFDIDLSLLWSTVVEDLPALMVMLERGD